MFSPRQFVLHVLFLCAFALSALAQSESGSAAVEGTITDANANAVPGAIVTVRSIDTGYARTLTTNEQGRFIASVMPVGMYVIEVKATGFATTRRESLQLIVGNTEAVNLRLAVASVTETVTVSAETAQLDTEEGVAGSTVEQRSVRDLPIRGRNFTASFK